MNITFIILLINFSIITCFLSSILDNSLKLLEKSIDRGLIKPIWPNQVIKSNLIKAPLEIVELQAHNAFAAYCNSTILKNWQCKACLRSSGMKLQGFYSNKLFGTQAYLGTSDKKKQIVLAFRGTETFIDDIEDIDILLIKSNIVPINEPSIHSGFLIAMNSIIKPMIEDLKELLDKDEYKDYKITFVGHSLGGAIATLGLLRVQKELNLPYSKLQLFTYGQPRAGNYKFASWFDTLPIVVARVVNKKDLVPSIPPNSLLNYSHIGNEVYIMENNTVKFCKADILEDPSCSYAVSFLSHSINDHYIYFGIHSGQLAC